MKRDIGDMFTFVFWHEPGIPMDPWIDISGMAVTTVDINMEEGSGYTEIIKRRPEVKYLHDLAATMVKVPVDVVEVGKGMLVIEVTYRCN